MNIYETITNVKNFNQLKLKDINSIKITCKVVNAVSFSGNIKRYFYKIIIDNEKFNFDLDKKYNIIELLEIVKNDILCDLPF